MWFLHVKYLKNNVFLPVEVVLAPPLRHCAQNSPLPPLHHEPAGSLTHFASTFFLAQSSEAFSPQLSTCEEKSGDGRGLAARLTLDLFAALLSTKTCQCCSFR